MLIVLGAAVGAILWPTGLDAHLGLRSVTFFDESLFVYILLPPIIFEAGFEPLIKRPFFRNLGTILLFAVPGTVLTTLVIGGALYAAGAYGAFRIDGADALDFRTPLDSFVFGAPSRRPTRWRRSRSWARSASSTHSHATLRNCTRARSSSRRGGDRAESSSSRRSATSPAASRSRATTRVGIGQFLLVCLGSLAIAAAVCAASALLLRVLRRDLRHHASFEVALIFLFGYVCYVAADAAGCSGILSLFVAGVLESHYHVYSLSESGRHATAIALMSLAHTFEADFRVHWSRPRRVARPGGGGAGGGGRGGRRRGERLRDRRRRRHRGAARLRERRRACAPAVLTLAHGGGKLVAFVAFAVALVLLSRAIVVPPLCALSSLWKRSSRIRANQAVAIVLAGLRARSPLPWRRMFGCYTRPTSPPPPPPPCSSPRSSSAG